MCGGLGEQYWGNRTGWRPCKILKIIDCAVGQSDDGLIYAQAKHYVESYGGSGGL